MSGNTPHTFIVDTFSSKQPASVSEEKRWDSQHVMLGQSPINAEKMKPDLEDALYGKEDPG